MKNFTLLGSFAFALLAATAAPALAQSRPDDSTTSTSAADQGDDSPAGMRERSRHAEDGADDEGPSQDGDADEGSGYGPPDADEDRGPSDDRYAAGPDSPDMDEDRPGNGYSDGDRDGSDEDDTDDDGDGSSSQA